MRIGKARTVFNLLHKIWNSRELSRPTELRIFNSNVKAVFFYVAETWRTNVSSDKRVQAFINKYLRRILRIWLLNCINHRSFDSKPINSFHPNKSTKGNGLGLDIHEKDQSSITRQECNLKGKRRRGRLRNTWRKSVEDEMSKSGNDCQTIGTHLPRWHRTESDGEGQLSVAYALLKSKIMYL